MATATAPRMKKEEVLALGQQAPEAMPGDYVGTEIPTDAPAGSLRVVDKDLKTKLVNVRAAFPIQSPVGNPERGGPNAKRPYIVRLYPNFDAPEKPKGPSRAPRGSGSSGGRQPSFPRGFVPIPETMLPLDFTKVRQYMEAVNGNAQREFERRKQNGLTEQEVTRAIKGLSGPLLLAKLRQLEDEQGQTFEQYLNVGLGFPSEMIKLFGIPEPGPDTKQDETLPQGNGPLTPPKGKGGASGSKK